MHFIKHWNLLWFFLTGVRWFHQISSCLTCCIFVFFFLPAFISPAFQCCDCVQNYFGDAWNVFDFIIVLGSYIDIIYTEVSVSICNNDPHSTAHTQRPTHTKNFNTVPLGIMWSVDWQKKILFQVRRLACNIYKCWLDPDVEGVERGRGVKRSQRVWYFLISIISVLVSCILWFICMCFCFMNIHANPDYIIPCLIW